MQAWCQLEHLLGILRQDHSGISVCLLQTSSSTIPALLVARCAVLPSDQTSEFCLLIVNACARRLGSRRKEEGQSSQSRGGGGGGGGWGGWPTVGATDRHRFAAPPSDWGGSHRAGGVGGGGGWRQKVLRWEGLKEARSGSACSRRFPAGSRGEFC